MARITIAAAAGIAGFVAYIAAAVTLADVVIGRGWAIQAAYFVAAGVLWVIPARWLMFWAARK